MRIDHLAVYQSWMRSDGQPIPLGLMRLSREQQREILTYLEEIGLYIQTEARGHTSILVHAVLDHFASDKALEDYGVEDFLFCRPSPEDLRYPDRFLVCGHTTTRPLRQQMGEAPADTILRRGNQIAIYCNCSHDGRVGCSCRLLVSFLAKFVIIILLRYTDPKKRRKRSG